MGCLRAILVLFTGSAIIFLAILPWASSDQSQKSTSNAEITAQKHMYKGKLLSLWWCMKIWWSLKINIQIKAGMGLKNSISNKIRLWFWSGMGKTKSENTSFLAKWFIGTECYWSKMELWWEECKIPFRSKSSQEFNLATWWCLNFWMC